MGDRPKHNDRQQMNQQDWQETTDLNTNQQNETQVGAHARELVNRGNGGGGAENLN